MYGSQREVLAGLIRALPEPESAAPVRALQVARGLPRIARVQRPHFTAACEVAQMLADGVGLPSSMPGLLAHLTERWDGKGPLRRAKGEEIPLPMRIVHVAVDATFQRLLGGVERAARLVRERAGGGIDPEVAACFVDDAEEILALDPEASAWDEVLACEPQPRLTLEGEAIDRALSAMGGFADLISPYFTGHSAGVAELARGGGKALPAGRHERDRGPAGGARPRPRPSRDPRPHLAEARAADGRTSGSRFACIPTTPSA